MGPVFLGELEAFSTAFDGGCAWLAVLAAVATGPACAMLPGLTGILLAAPLVGTGPGCPPRPCEGVQR